MPQTGLQYSTQHLAAPGVIASGTGLDWKKAVMSASGRQFKLTANNDNFDDCLEQFPEGFTRVPASQYLLRPGAIESIFVLYRNIKEMF
jgi:type III secretion system FlhB-like substrate exporter